MDIKTEDSFLGRTFHEIVTDSVETGIMVTDCSGKLLYINRAAEDMWGLHRQDALGQSFLLALAGHERERMTRTFEYVVRTGRTVRARDIVFVNHGGQTLYINAYASPFRYSEVDDMGIVMWTENITEERILRREIHQADKLAALGQLTLGLAHELRTPLGTIKALADLIELNLGERQAGLTRYISVLKNEVNRLDRLSRELLDFGGKKSLNREGVDINSLVEKTLYLASLNRPSQTAGIEKDLEPGLPEVCGDPGNLMQALMNLVLNAFDALGEEGTIYIKTFSQNDTVLIEVQDTGVGIDPENLHKVFDPFYTTKEYGTGLGLSVAHTLINDHRGRIEVESQASTGTVFRVSLPINQEGER